MGSDVKVTQDLSCLVGEEMAQPHTEGAPGPGWELHTSSLHSLGPGTFSFRCKNVKEGDHLCLGCPGFSVCLPTCYSSVLGVSFKGLGFWSPTITEGAPGSRYVSKPLSGSLGSVPHFSPSPHKCWGGLGVEERDPAQLGPYSLFTLTYPPRALLWLQV